MGSKCVSCFEGAVATTTKVDLHMTSIVRSTIWMVSAHIWIQINLGWFRIFTVFTGYLQFTIFFPLYIFTPTLTSKISIASVWLPLKGLGSHTSSRPQPDSPPHAWKQTLLCSLGDPGLPVLCLSISCNPEQPTSISPFGYPAWFPRRLLHNHPTT